MGWAIDSAVEVFKKSLDWKRLWLPYIALGVLMFILSFAMMFATFGMQPFFAPLMNVGPLAGLIIYMFGSMLFGVFFLGISLSIAFDYLKKGKFSFSKAMERTKKRFIVMLVLGILFGAIYLILSVALFFPAGVYISAYNPLGLFAGTIAYMAIIFLAAPFLLIVAPVALFENHGVIASLYRIIELGKRDYLATLGYLLMLFLFFMAAYIVFVIAIFISILLAFVLIGIPLLIISFAVLIGWLFAYYSLAMAKLYQAKTSTKK